MKQCTIYAPIKDYEKIIDSIAREFMGKNVEVTKEDNKVKVIYKKFFSSFSITFSMMTGDSEPQRFEEMMEGMYGYFYRIQTEYLDIKGKVLEQLKYLKVCVGIVADKEINGEVFDKILHVVDEVSGVLFIPTGAILDKKGKVVLNVNGESEVEDFIVTASSDLLDNLVKPTKAAEERKKRSIEILKKKNIPYIEHLPVIEGEEEAVIRSKEEVAKRAIALALITTYASELAGGGEIGEARGFLNTLIKRYGAEELFTEDENSFINNDTPDEKTMVEFSWQYECFWVLLWTLGYVKELSYPNYICDVQAAIGFVQNAKNLDDFINKSSLRCKEEILDQADLIYRYDWACVDCRIKNKQAPGGLDGGVVMERHRAFNWLVSYMDEEWDHVKTNT